MSNNLLGMTQLQSAAPPTAGMGWWWSSDHGRYDDTTGGSSVDADAAALASWADKINGTRVTQSVSANRPTYDAIWKDVVGAVGQGVNTWFDVPSDVQFNRRASTIVAIVRPNNLRQGANGSATYANRILMNTTAGTPYNVYYDGSTSGVLGRVTVFDGAAAKTFTAATLRSSPNLVVIRGSASSSALSLNGTAGTVSAPGTGTVTVNALLGSPSAFAAFQGALRDFIIYPSRNLSDAEVANLLPWAATRGVPLVPAGQEVYEGDSITHGLGASVNRGWPNRLDRSPLLRRRITAQSGISMVTLASTAATRVDPLIVSGEANKLYIFAGTNDIALNGATAANTYTSLTGYTTARQAAGWTVVWITPLPRGANDSATQTAIKDYRDLMLAGAAGAGVAVVDAWGIWGLNGNNSSSDFYDATHPNDSGYAKIALLVGST